MLVYNGRWLQINGAGTDWPRARQAYDAAQVELALVYGITTFRLPELPADTVSEVRRRHGVKDQDPGREPGGRRAPGGLRVRQRSSRLRRPAGRRTRPGRARTTRGSSACRRARR